jgi:hypothetical protein
VITFTKAKVVYRNTEPFFRLHDGYTMKSGVLSSGYGEATYDDLLQIESEAEYDCSWAFEPETQEHAYNWLEKVQAEITKFEQKFKKSLRNRGIELRNSIES